MYERNSIFFGKKLWELQILGSVRLRHGWVQVWSSLQMGQQGTGTVGSGDMPCCYSCKVPQDHWGLGELCPLCSAVILLMLPALFPGLELLLMAKPGTGKCPAHSHLLPWWRKGMQASRFPPFRVSCGGSAASLCNCDPFPQ